MLSDRRMSVSCARADDPGATAAHISFSASRRWHCRHRRRATAGSRCSSRSTNPVLTFPRSPTSRTSASSPTTMAARCWRGASRRARPPADSRHHCPERSRRAARRNGYRKALSARHLQAASTSICPERGRGMVPRRRRKLFSSRRMCRRVSAVPTISPARR